MKTPKTISGWCMMLFFLLYGVSAFVAFPMANVIVGGLALATAIFTLIGK